MRRLFALATGLAILLAGFVPSPPAQAQVTITWVGSWIDTADNGCSFIVALWSDGSVDSAPWQCPPGVVVLENGVVASDMHPFQRVAANGCTEYVVDEGFGFFTVIPTSCPAGVLYARVPGFADPLLPPGTTKRFPFPDPNLFPMLLTRTLGIR
jgi:hypothetical protein